MVGVPLNSHDKTVGLMGRLFVVFSFVLERFCWWYWSLIYNLTKVFARCFQERKWTVVFFAQTEIKVFRKLVLLTAKAPENWLKP